MQREGDDPKWESGVDVEVEWKHVSHEALRLQAGAACC